MNKKVTKRALFMSFVSMFLCFTMLLGTTYAWFTDSVTSGVNTIVAGNLDVELYHTNKTVANETVQGATNLFKKDINGKDVIWEPGAMVWENFTVANEGDLALKYQFVLETESVGIKDLTDVLKVAVVEGGVKDTDTRETLKEKSFVALDEFASISGTMLKDAADATYGVVVYWAPTENDNDYNMNNANQGEALSVNIYVKLFATQVEAESDSFDKFYDKDATIVATSNTVALPNAGATATEDKILTTSVEENVTLTLSKEFLTDLVAANNAPTEVALSHAEPKFDKDNGTVTFDHIEIVDANGNIVDLEALGNDEPITVKFNVGDTFDVGDTVRIYHDDKYITEAIVDADKNVTYETTHFCEVVVSDSVYVSTEAKLVEELAKGGRIYLEDNITVTKTLNVAADTVIYGQGNTLTYTGSDTRVIDAAAETGADLTVKDLIIEIKNGYCQRGINYNVPNGNLVLDNVTLTGTTKATYGVNLPGKSVGAKVEIVNSDITAHIALNVWGANSVINVTDSNLSNYDPTDVENYATIVLNNDGSTIANGTVVTITGGSITAKDHNGDPWNAVNNSTATGSVTISNTTKVFGTVASNVANVRYKDANGDYYDEFYGCPTLQDAFDKASESANAVVVLIKDLDLDATVIVPEGKTVVLDLNGKKITAPEVEFPDAICAIQNKGNLTVIGEGTIEGSYTALYSNGKLTIEGGNFESDNGFGVIIDNIYGTKSSVATINGGTFTGVGIYNPTDVTINGGTFNVGRDPDGASDQISNNMTLFISPTFDGAPNTANVTLNGGTFNGDVYVYDDGITETVFANNGATITGDILDNA